MLCTTAKIINSLGFPKVFQVIPLLKHANHHPVNKAIYFTEQPEPINWLAIVSGITGSGSKDQRCSQSGHEHQVPDQGKAAHGHYCWLVITAMVVALTSPLPNPSILLPL